VATESFLILGQSAPAATTSTDLLTVPAATQYVVATLVVCNQAATPTTFRVSAAPSGAALATSQYLFYDTPIAANSTITVTIGMTLAATDKVRVFAGAAGMSFTAFGTSIA